jgi:hypothetical protein
MDPQSLIAPVDPVGYPAPYWFLVFFKVLGFTLHMVPMNLWYAGILVAMLVRGSRNPQLRTLSRRLMSQMPFIVAFGVNLGIVPILFIQVAYYRVFYAATILMAWWWLSIIAMVCVAYYAVYAYAVGLRTIGAERMPRWQVACGWLASALFIACGFMFHNAWTLMVRVAGWPDLAQRTGVDGAVLGTALNVADPTLGGRMLFFFGLALTTCAAYFVFDAWFFAGREAPAYRAFVPRFSLALYLVGLAIHGTGALWYGLALPVATRAYLLSPHLLPLTAAAALFPALPFLLIVLQRGGARPWPALGAGLGQFVALGLHAIVRQAVQNQELAPYVNVAGEAVNVQVSPLAMFLLTFVAGLALILWMLRQIAAVNRRELAAAGEPEAGAPFQIKP